ncbi:uncharacterized protein AB9X84_020412 isoform 1-T2 [Acanthopagrus schlegelii]
MGFLQNQNQTLGSSQPEVTHLESTPQLSSAVNDTIIVLGVLTFALQLCLALFFMLRFLRLDNRVREALKHPDAVKKLIASSCHPDMYKQAGYLPCSAAAALSPAAPAAAEQYEPIKTPLFAPSIPWDLVQN